MNDAFRMLGFSDIVDLLVIGDKVFIISRLTPVKYSILSLPCFPLKIYSKKGKKRKEDLKVMHQYICNPDLIFESDPEFLKPILVGHECNVLSAKIT